MDIEKLELTIRSDNGLRAAGIDTIEKLLALSWEDLWSMKNIGQKSVCEIVWLTLQVLNGEALRKAEEWESKYPSVPTDWKALRDKARMYDKIAAIVTPNVELRGASPALSAERPAPTQGYASGGNDE